MWNPGAVMRPVMVSSPTARPSIFEQAGPYAFRGSLGSATLGQTGSEWFDRAKKAINNWDALKARADRLTNPTERARILQWMGDPNNSESPAYGYASVRSDFNDAQALVDPGADYADENRRGSARQNRIKRLEDFVRTFSTMVTNAEALEPGGGRAVPTGAVMPVPAAAPTPSWVLPVAIGGGALFVALTISYFTK